MPEPVSNAVGQEILGSLADSGYASAGASPLAGGALSGPQGFLANLFLQSTFKNLFGGWKDDFNLPEVDQLQITDLNKIMQLSPEQFAQALKAGLFTNPANNTYLQNAGVRGSGYGSEPLVTARENYLSNQIGTGRNQGFVLGLENTPGSSQSNPFNPSSMTGQNGVPFGKDMWIRDGSSVVYGHFTETRGTRGNSYVIVPKGSPEPNNALSKVNPTEVASQGFQGRISPDTQKFLDMLNQFSDKYQQEHPQPTPSQNVPTDQINKLNQQLDQIGQQQQQTGGGLNEMFQQPTQNVPAPSPEAPQSTGTPLLGTPPPPISQLFPPINGGESNPIMDINTPITNNPVPPVEQPQLPDVLQNPNQIPLQVPEQIPIQENPIDEMFPSPQEISTPIPQQLPEPIQNPGQVPLEVPQQIPENIPEPLQNPSQVPTQIPENIQQPIDIPQPAPEPQPQAPEQIEIPNPIFNPGQIPLNIPEPIQQPIDIPQPQPEQQGPQPSSPIENLFPQVPQIPDFNPSPLTDIGQGAPAQEIQVPRDIQDNKPKEDFPSFPNISDLFKLPNPSQEPSNLGGNQGQPTTEEPKREYEGLGQTLGDLMTGLGNGGFKFPKFPDLNQQQPMNQMFPDFPQQNFPSGGGSSQYSESSAYGGNQMNSVVPGLSGQSTQSFSQQGAGGTQPQQGQDQQQQDPGSQPFGMNDLWSNFLRF